MSNLNLVINYTFSFLLVNKFSIECEILVYSLSSLPINYSSNPTFLNSISMFITAHPHFLSFLHSRVPQRGIIYKGDIQSQLSCLPLNDIVTHYRMCNVLPTIHVG